MKPHPLKLLRVGLAFLFFVPALLLFVDFRHTGPHKLLETVFLLQLIPSTMKAVHGIVSGTAGVLLIFALTLLFGRVYCAFICPLGILQDILSRLRKKKPPPAGRKQTAKKYTFSRAHNFLRYAVLLITLLPILAGSILVINLLDPFSSFGRISANIFRPMLMAVNNISASLLEPLGIHVLYQVQWPVIIPLAAIIALITLILVAGLAFYHGRLYCNTLCPVGTLLGLLSRRSWFHIRIDPAHCISCRACEAVCKAGCMDIHQKSVDASRCVACFNCLSVCPAPGAVMFTGHRKRPARPDPFVEKQKPASKNQASRCTSSRRTFFISIGLWGLMIVSRAMGKPTKISIKAPPTTIPEQKTSPVSPPGSISIDRFSTACTACHLCVSTCPSRVLQPSSFDYGRADRYSLSGMMQPRMDFHASHCNYDCTACLDICPTGALLPLPAADKKRIQIGVAKFIRENCVVVTAQTDCGACSEHCPTKAVNMVPYKGPSGRRLVIPQVNENICVGCGGCEYACPTRPYRAIYVNGRPVHQKARLPEKKKLENTFDGDNPFPF